MVGAWDGRVDFNWFREDETGFLSSVKNVGRGYRLQLPQRQQ